jgi:hypothetical protein
MAALPKFVGARIKRREESALMQSPGQYVDDIPMVGTLHAALGIPSVPSRRVGDKGVQDVYQFL